MHELLNRIREKIKSYLMNKLSDEEGRLNEYQLQEMLDYFNKRIFKVYYKKELKEGEEFTGSRIRRKKLLFRHDEEPDRIFTLTLINPTTKKRYTKREILQNIVDAIDAYLHEKGEWKLQEKKETELESFYTSSTSPSSSTMETEKNKSTITKCCYSTASKWYKICDNDNDSDTTNSSNSNK